MLTIEAVEKAVKQGGTIQGAARLLEVPSGKLYWWLARNGYKVVKKAALEPINPERLEQQPER